MGYNAAPLARLIEQFAKLPGIGRKGATRLAYQVLSMDKEEALDFARAIEEAHTKIHRCRVCRILQRMRSAPSVPERRGTTA